MAAAQQQQLGAHPPVPEAGAGAAESQGEGAWQALPRAIRSGAAGDVLGHSGGSGRAAQHTSLRSTSRRGEWRTLGRGSALSASPTPSTTLTTAGSGQRCRFGTGGGTRSTKTTGDREEAIPLDELPLAKVPANREASKDNQEPPEIKKYFDVVREGTHTVLKEGKTASKVLTCAWYGCKSLLGCRAAPRSRSS